MSFASPLWLFCLLLVPLALAGYLESRRRARRYSVRFTAVPALKAAVGRGGVAAWRRHLPAALALAALAVLSLAMARPHRTVAVPIEQASIMLVTDHSGSMQATDVDPDRLSAAQDAAHAFLDQLPGEVQVGLVAFSTTPDAVQAPSEDHEAVRELVDDQEADGATATGDALRAAIDSLTAQRQGGRRPPAAIVLLSDGKTTAGRDPVEIARQAGQLKIPIHTVSLGTDEGVVAAPGSFGQSRVIPVPPDPETLQAIAEESGGRAFTASDEERLTSIYKELGSRLGTREKETEATAGFATAGLVLLLGAGLLSVRSLGRLP